MQTIIDYFWDGRAQRYTPGFGSTVCKLISILAGIIWFITFSIQLFCYIKRKQSKVQQSTLQESCLNSQSEDSSSQKSIFSYQLRDYGQVYTVLEIVSDVLLWSGTLLFVLVFSVLSGFGFFTTSSAIMINSLFLILIYAYQIIRLSTYRQRYKNFTYNMVSAVQKFKWYLLVSGIILITYSIVMPWVFKNSCLCIYNSGYGIPTVLDMEYSSIMTRGQNINIIERRWLPERVCPEEEICHVYATLPSNTWQSVFINVHTGTSIKHLNISYIDGPLEHSLECQIQPFPSDIEDRGQRNLFVCFLTQLPPNSTFQFSLHAQNKPNLFNSTYRTLPQPGMPRTNDVTILFGGDYGYLDEGRKLVSEIQNMNIDVILIGGDVAYDNGNIHCYYSWDLMLRDFENQFSAIQRIIPFIFSVGNHDVGFNTMAYFNISVSEEEGPLYFIYFPQLYKFENNQSGIPSVHHRRTFNDHIIGDSVFLGLDAGYLQKFDGIQLEWMQEKMQHYSSNYSIFVHYHDPIYPTCWNDGKVMTPKIQQGEALKNWVPIFDRYNVVAAFENHVHQFKRTFPLKDGKVNPNGTVYFGDGAMGIRMVKCKPEFWTNGTRFNGLFASYKIEDASHFWIMKILPDNTFDYTAYSPSGSVIDNSQLSGKAKSMRQDMMVDL